MMARLIVENVVAFPPPSKNSNKNTANNNNYMKGFLLGAKFGKQKRS